MATGFTSANMAILILIIHISVTRWTRWHYYRWTLRLRIYQILMLIIKLLEKSNKRHDIYTENIYTQIHRASSNVIEVQNLVPLYIKCLTTM